jgi:hypothetical protein
MGKFIINDELSTESNVLIDDTCTGANCIGQCHSSCVAYCVDSCSSNCSSFCSKVLILQ